MSYCTAVLGRTGIAWKGMECRRLRSRFGSAEAPMRPQDECSKLQLSSCHTLPHAIAVPHCLTKCHANAGHQQPFCYSMHKNRRPCLARRSRSGHKGHGPFSSILYCFYRMGRGNTWTMPHPPYADKSRPQKAGKAGKACTNEGMQEERTHTTVSRTVMYMYVLFQNFWMRDERLVASTSPNHFVTIAARAWLFADSWPIAFVRWFAVNVPCTRSMLQKACRRSFYSAASQLHHIYAADSVDRCWQFVASMVHLHHNLSSRKFLTCKNSASSVQDSWSTKN